MGTSGETCPVCGDEFTETTAVRDHAWDAHGVCHHCGTEVGDRDSLYVHWLENHESDLSAESRKRAQNTVGERTVCPQCGDRFSDPDTVAAHARDAHGVCHRCGDGFAEVDTLYAHWLGAHGDDLTATNYDRAASEVGELNARQRFIHEGPIRAVTGASVSRRALVGAGGVGLAGLAVGAVATGAIDPGGGDSGATLQSHPAASGLSGAPVQGPDPVDADGTIIAFEDPSCPSCARFELSTFPTLKSRLIDTGSVAFAYRGIPVVYPWGDPAVLALEATLDRDEGAFWALKDHYYRNQDDIGTGNVTDVTKRFLDEETDVDGAAVVEDVGAERHRDAVDRDLRASRQAGVRGTPTFFLFQEERYVTDLVGPQSVSVFKNTLGL